MNVCPSFAAVGCLLPTLDLGFVFSIRVVLTDAHLSVMGCSSFFFLLPVTLDSKEPLDNYTNTVQHNIIFTIIDLSSLPNFLFFDAERQPCHYYYYSYNTRAGRFYLLWRGPDPHSLTCNFIRTCGCYGTCMIKSDDSGFNDRWFLGRRLEMYIILVYSSSQMRE